jgi:hypothetical protein
MTPRLEQPVPVDYDFSAKTGVDVKGDVWSAIEVPQCGTGYGIRALSLCGI